MNLPSRYAGSNTLVVPPEPGRSWPRAGCSHRDPIKAVPACGVGCARDPPQEEVTGAGALGRTSRTRGPAGRWLGLSWLVEVPSCGACTATVARLKLVTPAIETASLSAR